MASCTRFTCDQCGFAIDCWDDGNRYLEWPGGTRNYLYHPSDGHKTDELMLAIYGREPTAAEYANAFRLYGGNESGFLCTDCAIVNRIDPKRDPAACKRCGSNSLRQVKELAKMECPKCRLGQFDCGEFGGIS